MAEVEPMSEESSHYEISLTAGQAFIAFVLLLLSLAASFAFGIVIGKGQVDERLVVRHDPSVITESSGPATQAKIVELGVPEKSETVADNASTLEPPVVTEGVDPAAPATQLADAPAVQDTPAPHETAPAPHAAAPVPAHDVTPAKPAAGETFYAQVLSSSDNKSAETLAAKLIDNGFRTAYVERTQTEHGMIFRVRVRFASEAEARASVDRLKPFAQGDVWVTKQ